MKGRFISFEGPEGSGKSTQASLLAERLESAGREVMLTREPGGTTLGEAIRAMFRTDTGRPLSSEAELFLFSASRAELVRRSIMPALDRGVWVVADRFVDSTVAYQGYGRRLSMETVSAINSLATGGLFPDVTVFLDLDVETGFARVRERNRVLNRKSDRFESESIEFHRRVYEGYVKIVKKCTSRFVVVDAGKDPDTVAGEVWKDVCSRLELDNPAGFES